MGGDWYIPILMYGISVSWQEVECICKKIMKEEGEDIEEEEEEEEKNDDIEIDEGENESSTENNYNPLFFSSKEKLSTLLYSPMIQYSPSPQPIVNFYDTFDKYNNLIKKKYNLNLYNYVSEAYSRWEGRNATNEDYFYVIGLSDVSISHDFNHMENFPLPLDKLSSSTLLDFETKTKHLFDRLIEDFRDHKVKFHQGILA